MILRLLSQVPAWVIRASLEASLIALLVLLAQFLLRDRVSARWRYNLWLLVIARLLLPALPGSRLSPFNWMQVSQGARVVESMPVARTSAPVKPIPMPTVQPVKPVKPSNRKTPIQIAEIEKFQIAEARYIDVPPETDEAKDSASARVPGVDGGSIEIAREVFREHDLEAAPRRGKPVAESTGDSVHSAAGATSVQRVNISQWIRIGWRTIGLIAWASVALLLLLRAVFTSIRITLTARQLKPIEDAWALQLLETCCADTGISRAPILVQTPNDIGPALVGLWNPRLLLPARVLETLNRNELRLVILHELVHLRRRDVAMNWVLALLGALHWFNPILWWSFARLRADRELACDEAVLEIGQRAGTANDARDYGRAMLKLLEAFSGGTSSPAAVGVLDGHPRWRNALMRRRITMIARFDKPKGWSLIGMSISLLIGAIALTGAVRGQSAPPTAQNAGAPGAAPAAGTTSATGLPGAPSSGMTGTGTAQNPATPGSIPGMPGSSAGGPPDQSRPPSGTAAVSIPGLGPGYIREKPDGTGGVFIRAGSGRAVGAAAPPAGSPAASPFGAPPGTTQPPAANPFGGPAGISAGAPPAAGAAPASDDSRFGHVEGPDAARADARTSENLRKPLTVAFNDVALSDLTSYLADQTGADVFIDNKALEEIGIDRNTPINLTLRQPLPAEEVLRLALRSAGGDTISYGVFHGVVTITSRQQLERSQITRAYSIPDFDNRGDELINAITRTIAPETWDTHGGPSSILILGKRMIVTTAEPRHREIARLLALLREGEPGPKADAAQPGAPETGGLSAIAPDKLFELQNLRDVAKELERLRNNLNDRGDTRGAELVQKSIDEYKQKIAVLEKGQPDNSVASLKAQLDATQRQLEELRAKNFLENHPRVIHTKNQIDELMKKLAQVEVPVDINGARVPAGMADEARRILKNQFDPKVYSIGGVEQNRAQIDEEFRKYIQKLVEERTSSTADPSPKD